MNRFSVVLLIVWLLLGRSGWGQVEMSGISRNLPQDIEIKFGDNNKSNLSIEFHAKNDKTGWAPKNKRKKGCFLTFTSEPSQNSCIQTVSSKSNKMDCSDPGPVSLEYKYKLGLTKCPDKFNLTINFNITCDSESNGQFQIELTKPRSLANGTRQDGDGTRQDGDRTRQDGDGTRQDGDGTRQDGDRTRQDGDGTRQDGDGTRQGGDGTRQDGDGARQDGGGTRQGGGGTRQNGDGARQNGDDTNQNGNGTRQDGDRTGKGKGNPFSLNVIREPQNSKGDYILILPKVINDSGPINTLYFQTKLNNGNYKQSPPPKNFIFIKPDTIYVRAHKDLRDTTRLVLKLENSGTWESQDFVLITDTEPQEPPITFIFGAIIGVFILVIILFIWQSSLGKKKKEQAKIKKIKDAAAKRQQENANKTSDEPEPAAELLEQPAVANQSPATELSEPPSEPSEGKTEIKFKRRTPTPPKSPDELAASALISTGSGKTYVSLSLNELWEDTTVKRVSLQHELMDDIEAFIQEMNIKPFLEDGQDAVPEIGGFILGTYQGTAEEGFEVFLEKFARITPGTSDVYRVSFETQAWAELAQEQDKYPDLETIAWFHTHPGHGLFLSLPDQRIHNGFFQEKYQLAMEIDTLSDGLDMALFSRMQSGTVNNRDQRLSDSWFKWETIMKEKSTNE